MGIVNIRSIEKIPVDISFLSEYKVGLSGSLTQSVEYLTFNQRVARSSRARPTSFSPHRLARFRTSAFHADNTGSNPVGDAKKPKIHYGSWLFFYLTGRHSPVNRQDSLKSSFGKTRKLPLRISPIS